MKKYWEQYHIPIYKIIVAIFAIIMMFLGAYFGKREKEQKDGWESPKQAETVLEAETIDIDPEEIKREIEENIKKIEEKRLKR